MKFWKRWISDIRDATRHCSLAQRGAYSALLDEYYSTQAPLSPDPATLHRMANALDAHERNAVNAIVKEFFFLSEEDGLLHNRRADRYLMKELPMMERRLAKAQKGAEARWSKPNAHGEVKEKKPRGNGHDKAAFTLPDWVPAVKWSTWMGLRKANTRKPESQAAAVRQLDKLRSQGHAPDDVLDYCIAGGYQGLFAPPKDTKQPKFDPFNPGPGKAVM